MGNEETGAEERLRKYAVWLVSPPNVVNPYLSTDSAYGSCSIDITHVLSELARLRDTSNAEIERLTRERDEARRRELGRQQSRDRVALRMLKEYWDKETRNAEAAESRAATLTAEVGRMREALEKIEGWDLPATDDVWDDGSSVSYQALHGFGGVREYIRGVARAALSPEPEAKET